MKELKVLTAVLLSLLLFSGCQPKQNIESGSNEYYLYYVNTEGTRLEKERYYPQGETTEALMDEFIQALTEEPESLEYHSAKPNYVTIIEHKVENQQASIYFSEDYYKMDKITEILCRAAVVRTVAQISNVEYVGFYVKDQPLVDANEKPVGIMTADMFIENAGDEINNYQRADLRLYFSDSVGDKLVEEKRQVVYSSNISLEKLVIEELIKGPVIKEAPAEQTAYPTMAPETKLMSVSVKDGICYVNFEKYWGINNEVSEMVKIYSVVNSLSEIPSISKVQISINGQSDKVLSGNISLGTVFERNLDLLDTGGNTTG